MSILRKYFNINCFCSKKDREDARGMTYQWIKMRAHAYFVRSDQTRKKLRAPAQVRAYLKLMRRLFMERLGRFPRRTPLRPRVTGRLKRNNYAIEKIIFESRPGFLVSGNLYIPEKPERPAPGVLFLIGHIDIGKAYAEYQRVCIDLVLNGFVVLSIDPIGQGERIHFPDKRRFKSRLRHCVNEHASLGWRSELLGESLGGWMTWDGIRGLDYLAGRKEVDKSRLAVTGCSGGGTQTAFIGAIDRRLTALVPNCYITRRQVLVEKEAILFDPEQVQHGVVREGLDHAELLGMAAPTAVMVQGGLKDLGFHPEGTRWAVNTARRWFRALGIEERLVLFQANVGHGYFLPFREATVKWSGRWLQGRDVKFKEPRLKTENHRRLWVTRYGNVIDVGGKTVLDFLTDEARKRRAVRQRRLKDIIGTPKMSKVIRSAIRNVTGFKGTLIPYTVTRCGKAPLDGYTIEKFLVHPEKGIRIPAVIVHPKNCQTGKVIVIASEYGKAWEWANNSYIRRWLADGNRIIMTDLRGWGETKQTRKLWSTPTDHWCKQIGHEGFLAQHLLSLGDSLIACRMRDLAAVLKFAKRHMDVPLTEMLLFARGMAVWSAVFLAYELPVHEIAVADFLASYLELFRCQVPKVSPGYVIHDALTYLDLPEVLAGIAPRPLWISRPRDAEGRVLSARHYQEFISLIKASYIKTEALDALHTGQSRTII